MAIKKFTNDRPTGSHHNTDKYRADAQALTDSESLSAIIDTPKGTDLQALSGAYRQALRKRYPHISVTYSAHTDTLTLYKNDNTAPLSEAEDSPAS
jgi:hypothetical protein